VGFCFCERSGTPLRVSEDARRLMKVFRRRLNFSELF
jgi:hypothetical protein